MSNARRPHLEVGSWIAAIIGTLIAAYSSLPNWVTDEIVKSAKTRTWPSFNRPQPTATVTTPTLPIAVPMATPAVPAATSIVEQADSEGRAQLRREIQIAMSFPNVSYNDKRARDAALAGVLVRAVKSKEFGLASEHVGQIGDERQHDRIAIRIACDLAVHDSLANALLAVQKIRGGKFRRYLAGQLTSQENSSVIDWCR